MEPGFPRRVTIVGLGLMGGSLALAIRRTLPEVEVVGVDFSSALAEAEAREAIHRGFAPGELPRAVAEADLVFLATPIRTILALIGKIAPHLGKGAILTDLGSTKAEICHVAQMHVPEGSYFIGGHPLTGAEGKGISSADPFLCSHPPGRDGRSPPPAARAFGPPGGDRGGASP